MMEQSLQYIVRPTTDAEHAAKMPYLTSSMVEAVNTCPRWGIIHNVLGKRFVIGYRQMALEAGSLMHDVFACLNLFQVGLWQNLPEHMHFHAELLFGKERWQYIWKEACKGKDTIAVDDITAFERAIFACIGSSEFYDDPNDKNRTVSNLEHCSLELLQYYLINLVDLPIYIADKKDASKPIGIEMSLDAVFELRDWEAAFDHDLEIPNEPELKTYQTVRCIGLADVVYQNPETKAISLGEYKTSSSMNDAWRMAFDTRHQITLYNALLQAHFGYQQSFNTILIGSAIPVRSTSIPVQHFQVDRDQENVHELLRTFIFTQGLINIYKERPLQTPMFTHSCNRYFRPCSMLDLCVAAKEDQYVMLDAMIDAPTLSPSEEKALLRNM